MNNKIVIIDDDSVIVQGMLISFELAGYSTECLTTGANTIELVRRAKPDLIFLDVMLDNGDDGRVITTELKSDPILSKIPVILISAMPNLKREAAHCKADDYLEKPFSVSDIVKKAKKYIKIKKKKSIPKLKVK